ncbi:hypothetical protein EHF33_19735 (plasmid) [Deinococcus psychrotolerans]|uniref:AlgX/AlgJ SGNH hydrolase-like domain-containing protein n=1 Tax=Deinococcus psychrotolerans TaxID=2489213 RepID=A0A3G8YK79_9DEIO|nr:hypothetical protein [Deinococcus psychrotolerans]AZI45110.1 hypothetical protein EHF33_19735 [Deinococcus psychrotolerans]
MTEFAQDTVKPNLDNPAAPRVLQWLPAAFLLAVVGVGAVLALTSKGTRTFPTGQDVVTGQWMGTYEKTNLDPGVPWRDASVNLWGGLNYRLFNEARDGAVIGKDGWLFTNEEFQTSKTDAAEIAGKVAYIKQVRDDLAKGGAKLVVALIPAKVRVYADELGSMKVPEMNALLYENFRQQLVAAGIPAPNLAADFEAAKSQGDLFFHTDTHWTPLGAQVAAQALAPVVKELGLDLPAATYQASKKPPVKRSGDLLRYVPVPEGEGPAPDTVQEAVYTRTDTGGGGLLGSDPLAVTLVGTSYSAVSKNNVWHFDGVLSKVLGTEVLNAAQEGKGPIVPMRGYLKSQDRKDNPPQVVVWEIPERFLRVDYEVKK